MKLLMLIVDKHKIALMVPTLQITQQFQLMPSMLGWKKNPQPVLLLRKMNLIANYIKLKFAKNC